MSSASDRYQDCNHVSHPLRQQLSISPLHLPHEEMFWGNGGAHHSPLVLRSHPAVSLRSGAIRGGILIQLLSLLPSVHSLMLPLLPEQRLAELLH